MSLVSFITLEADVLDKLCYYEIPLELKRTRTNHPENRTKTTIRTEFYISYQREITLIATINNIEYKVDISLEPYKHQYNLVLTKNVEKPNELIIFEQPN